MGTSTKGFPRASSVRSSTGSTISRETPHRFRCTTSPIRCATSSRRSTCSGPPAWGLYGLPSLARGPMPRDRSRDEEDDEEDENFWKGLGRDLLVAAIIVVVFLAAIYLYAGVWPPLVVVESSSMQHADRESFLGVIYTGDMVFQQAAPTRSSVVTYLEGRATGYATYGDYGDVIIFRRTGNPTPVIHRAIMYITLHPPNGTADPTADVPGLLGISNWTA